MQSSRRPVGVCALACAIALAAALGGASCGGSDESSGDAADARGSVADGAAQTRTAERDPGEPLPGSPRYEIHSSYATFVDYLKAQSPPATCDKLTAAFQRRIGGGWDGCLTRVAAIFASDAVTRGDREIVSLDIHDAGNATGRVRTRKGVQELRFKFDGRNWRIHAGNPWR